MFRGRRVERMAAQRYRLPDDFTPRYTPDEIRAYVSEHPSWALDHMFSTLPPGLKLHGMRVLDVGCGVTLQVLGLIEMELRWFGGHPMICIRANPWRCPDAESSRSLSARFQG